MVWNQLIQRVIEAVSVDAYTEVQDVALGCNFEIIPRYHQSCPRNTRAEVKKKWWKMPVSKKKKMGRCTREMAQLVKHLSGSMKTNTELVLKACGQPFFSYNSKHLFGKSYWLKNQTIYFFNNRKYNSNQSPPIESLLHNWNPNPMTYITKRGGEILPKLPQEDW